MLMPNRKRAAATKPRNRPSMPQPDEALTNNPELGENGEETKELYADSMKEDEEAEELDEGMKKGGAFDRLEGEDGGVEKKEEFLEEKGEEFDEEKLVEEEEEEEEEEGEEEDEEEEEEEEEEEGDDEEIEALDEQEMPQLDATVPQVQPSFPSVARRRRLKTQCTMTRYRYSSLVQNFGAIPFSPSKRIDFGAHEELFRALDLWDFVNLDLSEEIRPDLIIHLIATYDQLNNLSIVNGVEIAVSMSDLAMALKLPVDKEEEEEEEEEEERHQELFAREDVKGVVEEFVTNYVFLEDDDDDDMFIFPAEVMAATQMVKEGKAGKVDWAGLMWDLVEKEILNAPRLGSCHYASHLQCLLKYQQPGLFEGEAEVGGVLVPEPDSPIDASVDEEDSEGDYGRSFEELQDVGCERQGPDLSLGLGENGVFMDGADDCTGGEVGNWVDEGRTEHFDHCLRRCSSNEVKSMEFENLYKGDEDFSNLGTSTDLLHAMETVQVSYGRRVNSLDQTTGDFLSAGVDANKNMMPHPDQGPSIFFENNGKRHIENVDMDDDDLTQFHRNDQQKRMRSGGLWEEQQAPSGIDSYMEEIQRAMRKAKMLYIEREQACMEAHLQLQYLNAMVKEKDQIIQNMEKTRVEEQQKWQHAVHRYEHELNVVVELVAGYKKALKETRIKFAEYRKKCPQGDEPLYKDVPASGGLVLSSRELEMQRLEMRRMTEELIHNFECTWLVKFDEYRDFISVMQMKLVKQEGDVKLMKDRFAESKVTLAADPRIEVNPAADPGIEVNPAADPGIEVIPAADPGIEFNPAADPRIEVNLAADSSTKED